VLLLLLQGLLQAVLHLHLQAAAAVVRQLPPVC
jgi:hypothetical protein